MNETQSRFAAIAVAVQYLDTANPQVLREQLSRASLHPAFNKNPHFLANHLRTAASRTSSGAIESAYHAAQEILKIVGVNHLN